MRTGHSPRCSWAKPCKDRRLRALRALARNPAPGAVVLYADEVDIHLNPKIGLDWMNRGQQKEVVTPGQNEKRYLAGALNAATGALTCVEGTRKNSSLFVALIKFREPGPAQPPREIVQKIDLSGDIELETLKCEKCGGELTKESITVKEGAILIACPYCGSAYQMVEEPKW